MRTMNNGDEIEVGSQKNSETNLKVLLEKILMEAIQNYFPSYQYSERKFIGINERPSWPQTFILAAQHMMAMFGGTILVPLLAGFNTNTSLLFSGVGTIIFFIITGGKVPSYLGSSFSFLGVILSATGYVPTPGVLNPNISIALGGIISSGIAYAIVALLVMALGHRWIEFILPPVVTGSIIMAIGLVLALAAVDSATKTGDSPWQATATAIVVGVVSVFAPGLAGRLPILIGLTFGFLLSFFVGLTSLDPAKRIDFTLVHQAPWFAAPPLFTPKFDMNAISLITPVVIIQVAENLGHVKAVGVITDTELLPYLWRAYMGDALATIVSGCFGGSGLTTYAENIGVMAVTNVYSTLVFLFAACFAIVLGFIPKFGALINTIPSGVFGGLEIILFGLVAATGARIWIQNQVDFGDSVNLMTAAVAIVLGAGMGERVVTIGKVIQFDALGTSTIVCILVHFFFRSLPDLFSGKYKKKDGKTHLPQHAH